MKMNHAMSWCQKYAPKTLDDVILPPRIKNALDAMRTHHYPEHLLFYGTAGIGKTTTATLLVPDNTRLLNVKLDRVPMQARDIKLLLSSRNFFVPAPRRIVVIDDASSFDNFSQLAFARMLDMVLERNERGRLVLIFNKQMNLISRMRSCIHCIDFNLTPDELATVSDQFRRRLCEIAVAEGFTAENEVIDDAMRYAPDFRKVMQTFSIEILARQCAPDSQASCYVTPTFSEAQECQVPKTT